MQSIKWQDVRSLTKAIRPHRSGCCRKPIWEFSSRTHIDLSNSVTGGHVVVYSVRTAPIQLERRIFSAWIAPVHLRRASVAKSRPLRQIISFSLEFFEGQAIQGPSLFPDNSLGYSNSGFAISHHHSKPL